MVFKSIIVNIEDNTDVLGFDLGVENIVLSIKPRPFIAYIINYQMLTVVQHCLLRNLILNTRCARRKGAVQKKLATIVIK